MKNRIVLFLFLISLSCISSMAQVRILSIGDSTMADYEEVSNSQEKEKRGWAQMLPYFLTEGVVLENAARNGRSSKSFYHEFWENKLRQTLRRGDYVIIQFGHNDEKNKGQDTPADDTKGRGTAPWGQYQQYLRKYIEETRERGAIPILATPVVRGLFNEESNTLTSVALHNLVDFSELKNDSIMNYVLAMKAVAREMNVRLVDMTELTKILIEKLGFTKSKEMIYCEEDNTHLKAMGGLLFAELFAEDLQRQNILSGYIHFPKSTSVTPAILDFGSQFISLPLVKAFSIKGIDVKGESNLELSVSSPFEISLHPDKGYSNSIKAGISQSIFYLPVYVKFVPEQAISYKGTVDVSINGKRESIRLDGEGISVKREDRIDISYSPSSTDSVIHSKKGITVHTRLQGLKYENGQLFPTENRWLEQEIDLNTTRYLEISVTASKNIYLTELSIKMKAIGSDQFQFTTLGSFDKDFSKTDSYCVMEKLSDLELKEYLFRSTLNILKGKTYSFRIYPWNKIGGNEGFLLLRDLQIKGIEVK